MGSVGNNLTTEDKIQREEAKFEGWRTGAGTYKYIDKNGNEITGKTGRNTGGIYNAAFDPSLSRYRSMSVNDLQALADRLKAVSNDNYQKFTRSAASKSSSQVVAFTNADTELKKINQVLRSKKRNQNKR